MTLDEPVVVLMLANGMSSSVSAAHLGVDRPEREIHGEQGREEHELARGHTIVPIETMFGRLAGRLSPGESRLCSPQSNSVTSPRIEPGR